MNQTPLPKTTEQALQSLQLAEQKPQTKKQTPYKDEKLFQAITERIDQTKEYYSSKNYYADIERFERYYDNDYWYESTRSADLSRISSNDMFEVTEVLLPIITGRHPKPDVTAIPGMQELDQFEQNKSQVSSQEQLEQFEQQEKNYYEEINTYAENIQKELINIWFETDMPTKIQQIFREYAVKGKSVIKSYFDQENQEWHNDLCHYRSLFPEKSAGGFEDTAKTWFIHYFVIPVQEARKIYGVHLKADGEMNENGDFLGYDEDDAIKYEDVGKVRIAEMYIGDTTIEEFETIAKSEDGKFIYDKETGTKPEKTTKTRNMWGDSKFKRVTIAPSQKNWIIDETEVPYFNFFEVTNYKRDGKFWGTSEGKNIEHHSLAKNLILSNLVDNARLTGNPQKMKHASIEGDVTNKPGEVYEVTDLQNGITNIQPTSPPAYVERTVQWLDMDKDKKSGVNDPLRAISNSGDSGTKVQSLQSQAQGRLQCKLQDFSEFARKLYTYWAWVVQTNYSAPVIHEYEDESGEKSFRSFDPTTMPNLKLKIDVNSKSLLPLDPFMEFEEARLLYDYGHMSPEQLVETAPTVRDKQRIKRYIAEQQKKQSQEYEEQFMLAEAKGYCSVLMNMTQILEANVEDEQVLQDANKAQTEVLEKLARAIEGLPKIISLNEYLALPIDVKTAVDMLRNQNDEEQLGVQIEKQELQQQ